MNKDLITLKSEVEQASSELKSSVSKLEDKLSATLQQVSNTAERTIDQAKDFLRELNPVRQMRKHPMLGFAVAVGAGAVVSFRRSRREQWEQRVLEQVSTANGQVEVRYAAPEKGSRLKGFAKTALMSLATAAASELARRTLNVQEAEPASNSSHSL